MHKYPNLKAFIIFTVIALILTWPLLPHITTHYPSTFENTGGDPNMYIWFMDLMAKKVAHPSFNVSQMIFYPDGMNYWAGYEAPIILFVSTPVILITHNAVLAYNLVLLLAMILAGYVCYILIRYLTKSYGAALIAGLSFGFSEFVIVRATQHIDLLFLFPILMVVLYAFKFLENPSRRISCF
jgi:hypothetical protein